MSPDTKRRWYQFRLVTVFFFGVFFVAGVLFERVSNAPAKESPDLLRSSKDSLVELTLQKRAMEKDLRLSTATGEVADRNQRRALDQLKDIDFMIALECENIERVQQQIDLLLKADAARSSQR